ncbi:MAG: DUF4199 family protein [Bacteroidetes bacterium]|nr:DUF4199 family protein [Bacteroidota bacterium]
MKQRPSMLYGLIAGLVSVILFLTVYFTGRLDDMFSLRYTGSQLVISVLLLVLGVKADRKQMKGRFPFREAFFSGLLFFGFSWLVNTAFNQFMVRAVDQQLPVAQKALVMEKTEAFMVEFGTPEEEIQKAMDRMEAADPYAQYSLGGVLQSLMWTTLGSAIIAAIAAAFLREKRKPEYLEDNDSSIENN